FLNDFVWEAVFCFHSFDCWGYVFFCKILHHFLHHLLFFCKLHIHMVHLLIVRVVFLIFLSFYVALCFIRIKTSSTFFAEPSCFDIFSKERAWTVFTVGKTFV